MNESIYHEAIKAFRADDTKAVQRILKANPELKERVNEPMCDFESPPICQVKSRGMLDVLLEAGADINARSHWKPGSFGLLDLASPEVAEYAISKGAKLNAHSAARLGKIDALRAMLDEDPELVHARGGDGQLPLHFASTIEIAELLLDRGAEIDDRDSDHDSTAAQYMVRSRPEIARFLISRGANADLLMAAALDDLPLARAILDKDPQAIRLRVSDEFFTMISPTTGGTIYQWELGWYVSAHQVASTLDHEAMLDLLLERSPQDVRLIFACWQGDEVTVSRLLPCELGPVESRQLAHAARNNDLRALKLMLRAGLPIDARSQHGGTTLHWAAWHGNVEMADLLIAAGADVADDRNDYNSIPLDWAMYASLHGWNPATGDYAGVAMSLIRAGSPRPVGTSATPEVLAALP